MRLLNKNINIPISHPFPSGAYQDENKNWNFSQEINILGGWNQNKKTSELAVHITCATTKILNMYIIPLHLWEGDGFSGLIISIFPNFGREMCTTSWVFFHTFCDIYQ